ncbi:MAG: RNA methyltransferase [Planctomycetota bacterium]
MSEEEESPRLGPIPCRVVLVETHYPGNLGSVARVMRNMGLSDLWLVRPIARRDDTQAVRMAVHAGEVLDGAKVVGTLAEALTGCSQAAATAARVAGPVREIKKGFPREIIPSLAEIGTMERPVALVFGPEPSGLTTEDVALCHHLVKIPANHAYPSINLAQAVAICCYEMRLAWISKVPRPAPEPATFESQDQLFRHLRQALEAVGYLFGDKQETLMHGVRHLISRMSPQERDIKLIHGLARQILWYVRTHPGDPVKRESIDPE